jgi:hypothetical protein
MRGCNAAFCEQHGKRFPAGYRPSGIYPRPKFCPPYLKAENQDHHQNGLTFGFRSSSPRNEPGAGRQATGLTGMFGGNGDEDEF